MKLLMVKIDGSPEIHWQRFQMMARYREGLREIGRIVTG
jgi:hypothetical protein